MFFSSLIILATTVTANAQSLDEALSKFPDLSNFTAFYATNQAFASAYFGNTTAYPITFLAPNNEAFATFQERYGASLANIPVETLLALVQYHTLVSNLTTNDFDNSGKQGLTVPTMLNNALNNNRTAGVSLAGKFGGLAKASGQVVFIKSADSGSSRRFRLMSRQDGGQPPSSIRSGLSSNVGIQAINGEEGVWDGGRFHIVDGFLTPPTTCASTIRSAGLVNLDNALNRSNLWPALDGGRNLTCLGPNDAAFRSAGTPDATLNSTALADALHFHTLPEVAYSDYLYDGQEFRSLQNATVRVRVVEDGGAREIYFNNAKVLDANVLTHNGLMHVLDAVMVPLEQMNTTNTTAFGKPSATVSVTGTSTTSSSTSVASTGVASDMKVGEWNWNWWTLLGTALLMG
ncbi:Nn.00g101830.m01.CDS01 [Neocucurbitaria sp. VM-36]